MKLEVIYLSETSTENKEKDKETKYVGLNNIVVFNKYCK